MTPRRFKLINNLAVATLVSLSCVRGSDAATLPVYHDVVGEEIHYTVQAGDSLARLAPKFGMSVKLAAAMNNLVDPRKLRLGQPLVFSNRHIVAKLADGLVISIVDRTLYWFKANELIAQFPVAVGKADWETPPGRFKILSRRRKPTWHVPPAIQAEMREKGEPVKTSVPPGPDNPLGEYWLQLSAGDYGIHGTNAPWSVGRFATHGCLRLRPADVERLFKEAPNDTPVWVMYEPIKLASLPDGHVLIEAHDDIYKRAGALVSHFDELVEQAGLTSRIDLTHAHVVIKDAWGVAIDVTQSESPVIAPTPSPPAPTRSPAGPSPLPSTPAASPVSPTP
ncbi:MAG: L,D-transpeptidase family protein [Deltaproteobacteria bacterium]|nr:L,D-transpeptidase family protein [Deltaproteobacteria bacterium]MBI3390616.1 L,D-transpeptidase family protein [Deltaproteobacteria bacterium]